MSNSRNRPAFRRQMIALATGFGVATLASALSNTFTYQGNLQEGAVAANGSYDFQFALQTAAGVPVGAPLLRDDVALKLGIFTVELDFGAAISSSDFQLQIRRWRTTQALAMRRMCCWALRRMSPAPSVRQ